MLRRLLPIILALFGFVAGGCTTQQPEDSSIPWSRPANWEGGIPGMGGMGTTGR